MGNQKHLSDQLKAAKAVKNMTNDSFTDNRKTVSKLINHGKGKVETLCRLCDEMKMDIILKEQ